MNYSVRNTPNCIDEYVEVRDPTASTPLVRLCGSGSFPVAQPPTTTTGSSSSSSSSSSTSTSEPYMPPVLRVAGARVLLVFRYHPNVAGAGLRVVYSASGGALVGGASLLAQSPSSSLACGPDTSEACIGESSPAARNTVCILNPSPARVQYRVLMLYSQSVPLSCRYSERCIVLQCALDESGGACGRRRPAAERRLPDSCRSFQFDSRR